MDSEHYSDIAYQVALLQQTAESHGLEAYKELVNAAEQLFLHDHGVRWDGRDVHQFYPYLEIAMYMKYRLVISPAPELRV
jgi:hypothetical protein